MSEALSEIIRVEELDKYKLIKQFFESDNINFKTELNPSETVIFAIAEVLDLMLKEKGFDIRVDLLLTKIKELRVSKNRLGRQEAFASLSFETEEEQEKSLIKRLLGAD